MLATIHTEQIVPASIDEVWPFFATPRNLEMLTPPDLKFVILSHRHETMFAGQLIEYRISPLPGIWFRWLTEIRHVRERALFVDEQRMGPYSFWYHEHHFEEVAEGVKVTDHVTYAVGLGPLGWLVDKLYVNRKLKQIFAYRERVVREHFQKSAVRKRQSA